MQFTRRTTLALLTATVATPALAAKPSYYTKGGLVIGGYDPVAYFTEGKARKGSAKNSLSWDGATWQFASAQNMALFKANPKKYTPQYGGYCSYAMASGDLVSITPTAWDIYNGKLYLNYNSIVRAIWRRDKNGYIRRADKRWPTISKGLS
jgi:YHS domain-containing protein